MDVTPQLLREVEFRERLRGYHPDDVDDFLERVAIAVDHLLERLAAAEGGPTPGAAEVRPEREGPADDELRRTLVLAQRTADAVVAEARDEAARILAGAEERAGRLGAEHAALQARVDELRGWLDEARATARAALSGALGQLDAPVTLPEPPGPLDDQPPAAAAFAPADEDDAAGDAAEQVGDGHDGDGEDPPARGLDEPTGEHPVVDLGDDEPGEAAEQPDPLADLSGPALHTGVADDPFFTELRRAVTDDDPLGPRDDDAGTLDHLYGGAGDDDRGDRRDERELVSSRFRIRRRR